MKTHILILSIILLTNCQDGHNSAHELTSNIDIENAFKSISKNTLEDSTTLFSLNTITNFAWDSVLIITPYTPIEFLERESNLNLEPLHGSRVTITEGLNVLVFITSGKLVSFAELGALYGTFDYYDSTRYYLPSTANFQMVRTGKEFTNGDEVLAVEPLQTEGTYIGWK